MSRRPGRTGGLAAAFAGLGALQTLAFVHSAVAWWLPLLCTGLLARAVLDSPPARAAWLGGAYAGGWITAGTWWLYISMHRYGGLVAPLAALAVLALALALALYTALAMAAVARWRCGRTLPDAALFACAWLLAELARGLLFTGFPWVASGYAQVDGPLAWLAPWVGVYGIGAVAAGLAAGLATARRGQRLWPALLAAALAVPGLFGPLEFSQAGGELRVALLQTNIAQDEKFSLERLPAAMAWAAQAMTDARAELVVAPETALPVLPDQLDTLMPGLWPGLVAHFSRPDGGAALFGMPLGDALQGYSNAVVGLAPVPMPVPTAATANLPAGAVYRYDKSHLVPFGEFIPTGFGWFTRLMNIPLGDFNRGHLVQPSLPWRGQRIAPNICYEDLFGEELAQRFGDDASAPTLLVNLSNIGWFGDSAAIPQHLAISRMRSLELQRPMLRATNTGATAVVDHRGRVQAELPPLTRGVLLAQVQGRSGRTPFARWAAAFGLWPLIALGGAGLAWAAGCSRRRHRRHHIPAR